MKHTINFAAAPIITVFDDRGEIVQSIMFPICLLFILPCRFYAAWLSLIYHTTCFMRTADQAMAAWRHDLTLMTWAVRLILHQRRLAYV